MPTDQSPQQHKETLDNIERRSGLVISGLENSSSWKLVLEDFGKEVKRLDDSWQYIYDEKQWYEWRVTKLAAIKVVNLIEDYKQDLDRAKEELKIINNPKTHINKDVDAEGDEDGEETPVR